MATAATDGQMAPALSPAAVLPAAPQSSPRSDKGNSPAGRHSPRAGAVLSDWTEPGRASLPLGALRTPPPASESRSEQGLSDDEGAGGDAFRYYRFVPTRLRGGAVTRAGGVGVGELMLTRRGRRVDVRGAVARNPGGHNPTGCGPQMAIDDDERTTWRDMNACPLEVELPEPRRVDGYTFVTGLGPVEQDPVRWRFEASRDGAEWVPLHAVAGTDHETPHRRDWELPIFPVQPPPPATPGPSPGAGRAGSSAAGEEDGEDDGCGHHLCRRFPGVRAVVLGRKLNVLLLCAPLAALSDALDFGAVPTFGLSLLCLCSLAERISFVTEDVARYTSETIGGFVNATMSNVPEIVVSIFALRAGMVRVTQVALAGSVLSNLLFVLGTSLYLGGLGRVRQTFSRDMVMINSSLLAVAVMPFVLITCLQETDTVTASGVVDVSRFASVVLIGLYSAFLYFQLGSHKHLFADDDDDVDGGSGGGEGSRGEVSEPVPGDEGGSDEGSGAGRGAAEPGLLGLGGAIGWMAVFALLIAYLSELLVGSLEEASLKVGAPVVFVAMILLPVVNNFAEHASSVIFAMRDKPDIVLGVCVASAAQVAIFVTPLCIVIAWCMGQPLSFGLLTFEAAALVLSVFVVFVVIGSGESDWLRGLVLAVAYLMLAGCVWVLRDPETEANL